MNGPDRDRRTDAERRMEEALGPELGSDAVVAAGEVARQPASMTRPLLIVIAAAAVLLVVSFILVPPFDPDANDGDPAGFNFPADAIKANFELPIPHVAFDLDPSTPIDHHSLVTWDLTISSSLFTGWIVMAVIIVLAVILSRSITLIPTRGQNALEYAYEGLASFATSLGGPGARRYVPVFVTFFLYILLSNWSGLLPFVGRTEQLRAPTSDVNMTIGLALIAFFMFHIEGVRSLGFRGYFGKFFTLKGGPIGLFVGVLEFFLEFVKPVTLSMRLFGNIYAGEIALGVITGLTFVVIPVAMVGLEFLLNFMQALIFSVLTLMFTLIAIEGHGEEDHAEAHESVAEHLPEGNIAPNAAGA
ncbi:MAG TPA: F0F1 ATP synthase subunit A [Candidatus Limnocylindrales bacterium]|nr:F0F1 ATP synthase subunit A [Candidatus Limnocylindrales bacterium]